VQEVWEVGEAWEVQEVWKMWEAQEVHKVWRQQQRRRVTYEVHEVMVQVGEAAAQEEEKVQEVETENVTVM
jgi:hypothetical protein